MRGQNGNYFRDMNGMEWNGAMKRLGWGKYRRGLGELSTRLFFLLLFVVGWFFCCCDYFVSLPVAWNIFEGEERGEEVAGQCWVARRPLGG